MESNWIGPDVYNIYTDFERVRSQKDCLTEAVLRDFPESLQRIFNSNAKLKAIALPLQVGMNLLSDKTVAAIVDKSKVNSRPQIIPKQDKEELLDTALIDRRFIETAAVKIYN